MGNFIDYLEWRGDLSLDRDPFNEVDGLLMACLSYVRLDGIVPGIGEGEITVYEASEAFFRRYSAEELAKDRSFISDMPRILEKAAETERFREVRLRNYVNEIDPAKELQFSALEAVLPDGTVYISIRGTDDTIVGWKEDFNISFKEVPAEKEAVRYLKEVCRDGTCPIRIGGHSKGGHLAVFAAALAPPAIRSRISAVYDYDGPGFDAPFLQKKSVKALDGIMHRFIPESSVVGILLKHRTPPVYIRSSEKGPLQHNAFSWQVLGTRFRTEKELSPGGKVFDDAINTWIDEIDEKERQLFIDDFFSVLEAPGAETLTDLQNGGIRTLQAMTKKLRELRPATREKMEKLLKILFQEWAGQAVTRAVNAAAAYEAAHGKFSLKRKKDEDKLQ